MSEQLPLVSVVLPVYNAEKYLHEALASIVDQSYTKMEIIVINDGSTDNSLSIIKKFAMVDERIKIINRENKGLIFSLNEGISIAKGKYIARMDADDISEMYRIEKQVYYLNHNPDVSILGTYYRFIDENNQCIGYRFPPCRFFLIKMLLGFGSPLAHPSVMLNRDALGADLYYDFDYECCEDYELWTRLSHKYRIENLNYIGLNYRVLASSISRLNKEKQSKMTAKVMSEYIYNKPQEYIYDMIDNNRYLLLILHSQSYIYIIPRFCYLLYKKVKLAFKNNNK